MWESNLGFISQYTTHSQVCSPTAGRMVEGTHLEHCVDVVELGLQQVSPGGQVAVGEDAAGLQQPVGVGLNRGETQDVQSDQCRKRSSQA